MDPYFSGTKIRWLLDQSATLRRKAERGEIAFGTMDTWLIWNLTGGQIHVTDYTNASRTLCFDIQKKAWSPELLRLLKVPRALFPEVKASASYFGKTAKLGGLLPKGILITGVAGDQQAALYGQGCTHPGTMKNTYGTGCFFMVNTGSRRVRSSAGFLTTLACDPAGAPCYALEGSIFIAGAAIQWLRDELKLIKTAAETERTAEKLKDTGGVYVVPAFVGLGAPYWNPEARGLITGLTRGTNREVLIRATLESLAYQTKDVVDLMTKAFGRKLKVLRVDGGACRNNFLMQFQADLLNMTIQRPRMVETTARGAALLAGTAIGLYGLKYAEPPMDRQFRPRMRPARRAALYEGWKQAVQKALA